MANASVANGFIPYERVLRCRTYISSSICYPGDALVLVNDGTVAVAAASAALIGVCLSYAASGANVQVADHPDQLFVSKADETEVDAQTDINLNYNLVAGTASTLYKQSRHAIDSSTQATTATLPFKVVGLAPAINNALGTNSDLICVINNHALKGSTGTLGV